MKFVKIFGLFIMIFSLCGCDFMSETIDAPDTRNTSSSYGASGGGNNFGHIAQNINMSVSSMPSLSFSSGSKPQSYSELLKHASNTGPVSMPRRIEQRHDIQIKASPAQLESIYERDLKKCQEIGCEIIRTSLNTRSYALITARVLPDQVKPFIDYVEKGEGDFESHNVRSDDRTLEYIDVDAQVKTRQTLRKRYYKLLDDPRVRKIDEILRIERELSRVQQELDRHVGQRRHLETITDTILVTVNYGVHYYERDINYKKFGYSFVEAWGAFVMSLSHVIQFLGYVLPWLPVWVAGIWLLIKTIYLGTGKTKLSSRKKGPLKPQKAHDQAQPIDSSLS